MNRKNNILWIVALSIGFVLPAACSNSGEESGPGDGDSGGDGDGGDGDGDIDHGIDCEGAGTTCESGEDCCSGYCDPNTDTCGCAPVGDICGSGSDCCSGQCDPSTNTCAQVLGTCAQEGTPCSNVTECCSLSCVDGLCSGDACTQDGDSCSADGECCGGRCESGSCAPVNEGSGATCKSSGNACDDAGDCCSGLCNSEGLCGIGASFCVQRNDVCSVDSQCCQGVCIVEEGREVGYCGTQESGGTRCGEKLIAGEVCDGDCGQCCSRTCAPYGPSGVTICQLPTGCRTDGELCRSADDCCGGNPDSTVPGAGTAECVRVNPDDEVGRCKVGACNPDGAICGSPDDGTAACDGSLSAPNGEKCCGTKEPDWEGGNACVADSLRVPRCSTIPGGCVDVGGDCATSDDCCEGLPCVQNEDGRFVCYDPPGGSCVDAGGPCTTNADCCVGAICIAQPGQSTGVCGNTDPPGTGGSGMGGGSGTGGSTTTVCAEYGQDCESNDDCCGDVPCDSVTQTCIYLVR